MSRALIETAHTLLSEGYSPNLEKIHGDKSDHHQKLGEQHHSMYGKAVQELHKHVTALSKALPNVHGDDDAEMNEHMRHLENLHADVQHHFAEAKNHFAQASHHAMRSNQFASERIRKENKK